MNDALLMPAGPLNVYDGLTSPFGRTPATASEPPPAHRPRPTQEIQMIDGQQLAGFKALDVMGKGASSTIYAVMDPRDQQVYAIKRVERKSPGDQRFIDQALCEHEIAGRLDHPVLRKSHRIIRRRKMIKTSEVLVLMEMVDGPTLEQHRPPSLRQTIEVFHAAADGLDYMHQQGFVHCDIKPNNIIVSDAGVVKIIDFGQACPMGTVKTRIQGTPDYIAPEQVLRHAITGRTDIFNLGATMYWCLTNRHVPTLIPKSDREIGLKSDVKLTPPGEINPDMPKALNALVLNCLETEPNQRPTHMREVRDRLAIVLAQYDRKEASAADRS